MLFVKSPEILVFLTLLWASIGGDSEVCVLMGSCVLPCSFQPGDDAVIHWIQVSGNIPVHSYYRSKDQLSRQDQHFRGRTSLFREQISRGNASLQLTGVEVQDQGRYKCYTSTITGNKETFIHLNVEAPVDKVNIQQVENRITCSSEGIYPEPELTWSTSPPSNRILPDERTVQQTEQQLYKISSSLNVSDSVSDLVYSCTVSTGRNWRRATLLQPTSVSVSGTEATIPCSAPNTRWTGLIWRFNHSQIILNRIRTDVSHAVSEEWRQQVKDVTESGSLALQHLSSDQEGMYTCELMSEEENFVTNTFLRIEKTQVSGRSTVALIAAGVAVALVAVSVTLLVLYKKNRLPICKSKETGTGEDKDRELDVQTHLRTNEENNGVNTQT